MIVALTVKVGVGPIKVWVAFFSRHPCLTLWPLIFFCQGKVRTCHTYPQLTVWHIHTDTLLFSLYLSHTHTFSLFSQIPRSIWSSALEFCDHHSIEYTKNACLLFINSFPFRAWLEPASHGTLESSVVLWIFLHVTEY